MTTTPAQPAEPTPRPTQVTDHTPKPEGVISRRAQQYLIVGTAVVIVLIAMFSSNRQRKPATTPVTAVPVVHDNNDHKLADYSAELAQQQREAEKSRALPQLPPPSNPSAAPVDYRTGTVQQPYAAPLAANYQAPYQGDQWAQTADRDPIEQKERERAYDSRFASNIAYAANAASAAPEHQEPQVSLGKDTPVADPPLRTDAPGNKKPVNVNVNGATGQPYVLFEGSIVETALVNRLDGDFSGPVKVMVTNPVYSHDRQHVLIPDGSTILGEVRAVQGFGQRRLAVVFHRLIMPDGFTVDLDQFHGLNQVGETGLKDQVNNHYFQIFGTSLALGVIAGAAESSVPNTGFNASGSDAYRTGVASSLSQSSTRVLDKFLNINPTLTIREGHRIKVYLTNDLLLPAYENHTIPPNI